MTPEEQRAMIEFLGTIHAQAKQTDQMIVGDSQFVKPVSPNIKQQLEYTLRAPVQQQFAAPPVMDYAPVQPVPVYNGPQEEQLELSYFTPPPVSQAPQIQISSQETLEVLKEISLQLKRIADKIEESNVKPKRVKNSKPG